ncbi:unnamed protein product [Rangifer tarandus platyrhynchus]|uniref:Arginine vasopressin-induced protein 1 n=1 Tax=Rangifer tarandus platyrhynchus TaxID=3082113 RepID=A0ABN8XN47_RANTA|nr:unnamed protein product [Rangifer tarandus platyrhynchus]
MPCTERKALNGSAYVRGSWRVGGFRNLCIPCLLAPPVTAAALHFRRFRATSFSRVARRFTGAPETPRVAERERSETCCICEHGSSLAVSMAPDKTDQILRAYGPQTATLRFFCHRSRSASKCGFKSRSYCAGGRDLSAADTWLTLASLCRKRITGALESETDARLRAKWVRRLHDTLSKRHPRRAAAELCFSRCKEQPAKRVRLGRSGKAGRPKLLDGVLDVTFYSALAVMATEAAASAETRQGSGTSPHRKARTSKLWLRPAHFTHPNKNSPATSSLPAFFSPVSSAALLKKKCVCVHRKRSRYWLLQVPVCECCALPPDVLTPALSRKQRARRRRCR